jgi:hypothetical protein
VEYTTSRPCHFLCHTLFTTFLACDTAECGDSIQAQAGEIVGNYLMFELFNLEPIFWNSLHLKHVWLQSVCYKDARYC